MHRPRVVLVSFAVLGLLASSVSAALRTVEIRNFTFTPQKTSVTPGDTVRWVLAQGVHTTTSEVGSARQWDSGPLSTIGQQFDVVFSTADGPGPFPYLCTIHPMMKDTIFTAGECSATGDIDGDGTVLSAADHDILVQWLTGLAEPPEVWHTADLNGDCTVDQADLAILEEYFAVGIGVFDPYGGYPVATCCFPGVEFVQDSLTVSGLAHRTVGEAVVEAMPGGNLIRIRDTDGVPDDGVMVSLGRASGVGPLKWMAPESLTKRVFAVYGSLAGVADHLLGTVTTDWHEDSGRVAVDFSPLGIEEWNVALHTEATRAQGNPLYEGNTTSGSNPLFEQALKAAGNDPVSTFTCILEATTRSVVIEFDTPVNIDLRDGGGTHAATVMIWQAVGGVSVPEYVSHLTLTCADVDSILVQKSGLQFSGASVSGLGQSSLVATDSGLVITGIGSELDDGISIELPPTMGVGQQEAVLSWEPQGAVPGSSQVQQTIHLHSNGVIHRDLAARNCLLANDGRWESSADFSGIGAGEQTITVTLGGAETASFPGLSNASKCRHEAAMNSVRNMKGSLAVVAEWAAPTTITVDGQIPVSGDRLVIESLNETTPVDGVSSSELLFRDFNAIVIDGIAFVPLGCCLLRGDFNDDGAVKVTDLTALVGYLFRGGVAAGCPEHGDPNGDGSIKVSDLTYLVSYLFKGGPAPAECP